MLSAAAGSSVVRNMGCFCCPLASFWQIPVFIHSATCAVPRPASAGLSWEIWFLPLERGRGFLERAKQLGQGDLFLLHFNEAKPVLTAKKWGTSSPEKWAALLHGATCSVLDWSQLTPAGNSDVLVGAEHGLHPLFCSLCLCLAPCRMP